MFKIYCHFIVVFFVTQSALFALPDKIGETPDSKKPLGSIVLPEEAEKEKAKKPAADAKKMVKAKKELLEVKLELSGVIESKKNTPVFVKPKSWADLTVLEAVDHGTKVKKGDVLIRFETKKLEKAIEDEEASIPLAKLKLETASVELEQLEKTGPISLEEKRRAKSEREDDFAYFEEVRRPMNERSARERLKSYQNYLAYSEEELKQLKKMYENDDMTEETEEIILKRAQDSVDSDRWSVELIKSSTARTLNVTIPREHDSLTRRLKRSQIEWEVAEESSERAFETKRLEVEALERSLVKSKNKLADMKSDLNALVVKASHDGIVYYGANRKGKWATAVTVEKKLIPGGRASAREILMTLVDPGKLQVRVAVPEDKLKDLKVDQKADLTLKWNDSIKMESTVDKISYVPESNSTFGAVFGFDKKGVDLPVYPGMNAKLKLDVYRNENALVVPVKAVKKEGDKSHVILKNGKKRIVETGRATKEKQEIIKGLKAGDEIEADISAKTADKK